MTSWKGRPRSEAKPRGLSPCIASSDHGVLRTSHRTAPRHGPTIRLHSLLRHVTLSLARPPPPPPGPNSTRRVSPDVYMFDRVSNVE